jgi:D-alanyl-D-alanine carboxypeptidase/D-alanyl-D-alanine-endopeptidase (penicillin-binding protein 4)
MKNLKHQIIVAILGLFLNLKVSAQSSPNNEQEKICTRDLPGKIETIINNPTHERETWGIVIETLNKDQILYQLNHNKYLTPASNVKLLTTAASLLKLGPDYQIKTPVYISGTPPHLTSLRIIGKGDPTLTTEHLINLARQLKIMGVTHIDNLIVEDGYLPEPEIHPSWEYSDLYFYYAVPVNSLILNENTFVLSLVPQEIGQPLKLKFSDDIASRQFLIINKTITANNATNNNVKLKPLFEQSTLEFTGELVIDSPPDNWDLAIIKPGKYFLDSLRHSLLLQGINIKNTQLVSDQENNNNLPLNQEQETEFLTFESPNLLALITTTNQDSNNLYAEILLKNIALNSEDKDGIKELTKILTDLGIDSSNYSLKDGSGLSHQNLATPQTFVELLKLINKTKYGEIYRQSLTFAGVNGTLRRRFINTPIQGNLQGKTGTLTGVSALSGYVKTPNYEPIIFSIIVNNSSEKTAILRQRIDEIVLLLSQLNNCE